MLRVGLTGNIGSGKSTVARVWESMGARVLNADEIAKRLLVPGSDVLRDVVREFGEDILDSAGALDRRRLAQIVFTHREALSTLDSIVHPAVVRKIHEMMENDAQKHAMYVVEAALIFEAGKEADYDVIVMVDAPHERCVERVMRARGLSREEVERIARSQIPAGEKRKRAQIVIENDGAIEDLEEEARKVFRSLMDMERKENRG